MGISLVQNCRNRIIAAQPHLETASGQSIVIQKGFSAPLKSCIITINPVQLGSGDPSPTNVRELSGWTGLSVYVSPTNSGGTEYQISWSEQGIIYKGTMDITNGILTKTWYSFFGKDIANIRIDNYKDTTVTAKLPLEGLPAAASTEVLSNRFSTNIASGVVGRMVLLQANNSLYIIMPRSDFSGTPSGPQVQQWLTNNPTLFLYPLQTPITYQLTSQQITTLTGINNIWSNVGPISLQYWTN